MPLPRGAQMFGGVGIDEALAEEESEESAERRQVPGDGPGSQAGLV